MSPTIATLRSLSADLYPLPDRLRLIAEIVAADSTAYHDTVGGLLLEWANRLEKAHARLSVLCRTRPVPDDAAEDGEPLAAIAADLHPLPDRLRLMAEIVEGRGAFLFLPSAHLLGVEYISAEQRPVSVRTGGLSVAGERCSVFFCTL